MTPPSRPSLSITLPPSFEFHYNDGGLPRTPEHQHDERGTALNPPPPPRPQTFKVRRKRAAMPGFRQQEREMSPLESEAIVIPTIEMSESGPDASSPTMTPVTEGLLAPSMPHQRLFTPPKTPAPRTHNFSSPAESPANEWAMINDSRNKLRPGFERSGSVCSSFSDSSVSSCGSSGFSVPNNGCTSPESEATDPFLEDDLSKDDKLISSPDQDNSPTAKRVKTHRHVKWTQAMDDHLWMTFMQYLSDPRVTPFKMLAGTPPPLGVCSRVASKARRTWSTRRVSTSLDAIMEHNQREGSPDTIRPTANAKQPQWPRSDGATRRRLRTLCKRKPSLPAHYQRLLNTRSPSPFTSSSSVERTPDAGTSTGALPTISSHNMKMSLVTATNPSMQPDGPLAQLSSEDTQTQTPAPPRPQSSRTSRPDSWFARIPRSQAHQKSLSLQSGLSLNLETAATLASPFDDVEIRNHLIQSMGQTKSLGRNSFKDGPGPSLDSPVELSGAPTMPRTSLKRRFRSDEEKPKRPALQDVFGPAADDVGIVRNRGFTVGAVRASDNLANLFAPPPPMPAPVDQVMAEAPLPDSSGDLGHLGSRSVPRRLAEPVPRLGSPFTEVPNRQFNTFPRGFAPTASNPQPFQQRLRELAAMNTVNQQQ